MKIHEFQAKEWLKQYGIPIQDGITVQDKAGIKSAIDKVAEELGSKAFIIKAQVHAGGRGKGGGVKFAANKEEALSLAHEILGMQLVTPQTGAEGRLVKKIMITEALDIDKEFYLAIALDRSKAMYSYIVSEAGGMDIEEVAQKTPEKIIRYSVNPAYGSALPAYQARLLAFRLRLDPKAQAFKDALKIFTKLYKLTLELDASLVEINPLVLTKAGRLIALDAKMNFDDNALYRQKQILAMRDLDEEDPDELAAQKYNLNFIKLKGNVGCMVNGAGLAMATMDIIKLKGGSPANFLDVGGTASSETVKNAFSIILADPNVKTILINIFGGIVRCDRVAQGVVDAQKSLARKVPIVLRLVGTNADIAKKIIDESGLSIISVQHLEEAANEAVQLANKG